MSEALERFCARCGCLRVRPYDPNLDMRVCRPCDIEIGLGVRRILPRFRWMRRIPFAFEAPEREERR